MPSLTTLFYVSDAAPGVSWEDALDIAKGSRAYNAAHAITGILVFDGVNFVQLVNGSDHAIDELYARLLADRRHGNLEVFNKRPCPGLPWFAAWSLVLFQPLPDAPLSAFRGSRWPEAFELLKAALPAGTLPAHTLDADAAD